MLSFTQWLDTQLHRPDLIGELAVNVAWDTSAPPAVTIRDVRKRMRAVRALRCYYVALDEAAREYRSKVPTNVIPFRRARGVPPS